MQVSRLRKSFGKNSLDNTKSTRTRLSRILQSAGILDRLLAPLLKTVLPLTKNLLKALTKSVLQLRLTAASAAVGKGI